MRALVGSLISPKGLSLAFREVITLLTKHRELAWEMTKREMTDRYAGQVLGAFWVIGHPIFMMAIYVAVFGFIFQPRFGGASGVLTDATIYILSGLIPWMVFQESMSRGSTSVVDNVHLVKKVVFPIEVLPLKTVIALLPKQVIATGILIMYMLVVHGGLPWTSLLLPILVFLQVLAMVGVCYILASVGAFFRDIKDIVVVFCTANFFLMPMLYLPSAIPSSLRGLLYLNPFTYMVFCYQDALYFARIAHPWAWVGFAALSLWVFCMGYRIFRKAQTSFVNFL